MLSEGKVVMIPLSRLDDYAWQVFTASLLIHLKRLLMGVATELLSLNWIRLVC